MPSKKDHIKVGKFVALEVYKEEMEHRGLQRTAFGDLVALGTSNVLGTKVASLPDTLEPALSPQHRAVFHSMDVAKALEAVKEDIRNNPGENWQFDVGLIMAISAYQSHIILDSQTPMGVPDYQWLRDLLELFEQKRFK